jgi:hypothetical protein
MRRCLLLLALSAGGLSAATETWQALPRSEIKPRGWIRNQLERNLTTGNLSAYDRLRETDAPIGPGAGRGYREPEGNYFDALVRHAFLVEHRPSMEKATRIFATAVAGRLPNGYFGRGQVRTPGDIQRDDLELWSQCCFLRGALAYYEHTGRADVLAAVVLNVDLFITLFARGGLRYFQVPNDEPIHVGSRTHGLMYVDVLEKLFQITGDRRYVDFARALYDDYNASSLRNADNQLGRLLDREAMFLEHGPHTASHFRVPFFLSQATGDPRYRQAAENILHKLRKSQSPSRMLVADPRELEAVAGNFGSAVLPYEYCTILEMTASLASAQQKTGRATLGDDLEMLLFNAAQGARFPDGKANAYYARDSQWEAVFDERHPPTFRYQYAAVHQIGCCAINAARVLPAYVEAMWLRSADRRTLVAALHGASAVTTTLAGLRVVVTADTDYPFGPRVTYAINPDAEVRFTLALRSPGWSQRTHVEAPGAEVEERDGYIRVTKDWRRGDTVVLEFGDAVRVNRFMNNELFVQKGALIYALGFEVEKVRTKGFADGTFANYNLKLAQPEDRKKYFGYRMPHGADLPHRRNLVSYVYHADPAGDPRHPFEHPPGLIEGPFLHQGRPLRVQLRPMGSLLLRKVLFEQDK